MRCPIDNDACLAGCSEPCPFPQRPPAGERFQDVAKGQPLEVEIFEGVLRITIGVSTLGFAAKHIPNTGWDEDHLKVTDESVFAEEILRELQREQENGTTLVHRMLDQATLRAIEQGCEGVDHEAMEKAEEAAKRA